MNTPKTKKQKSLFKILVISFFSLAGLLIIFFSILFILFLVYKDDISKTLLYSVNQKINGRVSFSDISFTPFRHFPSASLKLTNLSLKESKDSSVNSGKMSVFNVKEAYVSVNIVDLFSSRINASAITIEGGSLNIIVYHDSQTNLEKAISQKQTVTDAPSGLDLQIDNLEIIDLELGAENQLTQNKVQLKIKKLQSGFSYTGNHISSKLNLDTILDSLIINNEPLISDMQINIESELEIESDSIFVKLEKGSLSVGAAKLKINGTFNSKNEGYIDLAVSVSDKDFSLLSLVLRDKEIKNLKASDLFFQGSVKGKTFVEFPQTEISFGLKDVELINPVTQRKIKNINLRGYFNSGKKENFSEARLKIDTLYANIPDGQLKFAGIIKNFDQPEFDISLFLKADVTGLDKVFKLDFIENLKGKIEINDRFEGKFNKKERRFESENSVAKISLENFGFNIPHTIKFDEINGNISRKNDDYYFDNLSLLSDDTDLLINGKVDNLQYLFFNIEKEISAELNIKSSVFDLPNFLAFDPSIKRDFNYRILNVDVDVLAKTTTSKALKFISFPEIEFDIKKLYATAENFLPPLKIKSGRFKISESILGFNLKCDNFKTAFLDGDFNLTAEYNSSKFQPFYIKAKTSFNDISPSILFYNEKDTIPESLSGKLSGSFFVELQFPVDSTILKFINLKEGNLIYRFSGDTINTKSLSLYLSDVYFNDAVNSNPFATLSTKGNLKASDFYSSGLNLNNIIMDFNVQDGTYKINSNQVRFFGESAKGKSQWILSPFSHFPSYNINYNVDKFYAEEMLTTFLLDTVITGPLSLSMDVNSGGSDWNTILNNMKGTINLSGKDLIFYGLDADEIIEKFKRSQSFTLMDLGAVLLAGPVGIAVTKGSDIASIFVFNSGERTTVNKLVSNWDINSGLFTIEDAAFTTNKNRIATIGIIDFARDTLDLTIALINKNGCSIFSQRAYGKLDEPELERVKVIKSILSPVTNLVNNVTGKDCDVFYRGIVKHPK